MSTSHFRHTIEQVKSRLPPFVRLIDDTYTEISSKADFYDIDYDQYFTKTVSCVIRYQTGCRQRTLDKFSLRGQKYTILEIQEYIMKHNIKTAAHLEKMCPSMYYFVKKHRLLCQFFTKKELHYYTMDELREISSKYLTRTRLKIEHPFVYQAIKSKKLTKEMFSHMKAVNISVGENVTAFIFDTILNQKSIRNSRNILPSKKELDIFYPELKLAIEYNGEYFHEENNIKNINDSIKKIECDSMGIRLFHIIEPIKNKSDIFDLMADIKQRCFSLFNTDINHLLNINVTLEDIVKIVVPNDQILIGHYTTDELQQKINSYDTLDKFRKSEPQLYGKLCKYSLIHEMTKNLKRIRRKGVSKELDTVEKFISHVKENFKTFSHLQSTAEYSIARRNNWIPEVRKIFPEMKNTWKKINDVELINFIMENFDCYSKFFQHPVYREAVKRKLHKKVKEQMKNRNNHS